MTPPQILIIENNIGDVILVKLAIQGLGINIKIHEVEIAEEGLDFLHHRGNFSEQKTLPNLIITDLSMPGIGGMKFLQIIKENPALKHIPVVIMTTSAKDSDREYCLKLGAEQVVIKPIFLDDYIESFSFLKSFFLQAENA